MRILLWLLVLPGPVYAARDLPRIKLTLKACEQMLVSETGDITRLRREVRAGLAARTGRELFLARTRLVGSLEAISSAPIEYFDENLRKYSRAELDQIKEIRMERGLSEAARLLKTPDGAAQDQQDLVLRAEASLAPEPRRSGRGGGGVLWKAALGINPDQPLAFGDIHSVRVTVERRQLRLTSYSAAGAVVGITGGHFYELRLGFPLDLARWQAERFIHDEDAFAQLSGRAARLEFFRTRGTVLFARQLGPVTIGFQFHVQPLLNGALEASPLRAEIVVIDERARNLLPRGYYVYPDKARRRSGEDPIFFGVRTDYALIPQPTPADQRAWFEGLRERVERGGE